MTKFVLGYTTTNTIKEAKHIAHSLVREKLVACANIITNMVSVYEWENKIEESDEFIVILKTTKELEPKIKEKLQELHSYSTPCLLFLSVEDGLPPFLNWIDEQTSSG